jgi:hypothetical protein
MLLILPAGALVGDAPLGGLVEGDHAGSLGFHFGPLPSKNASKFKAIDISRNVQK